MRILIPITYGSELRQFFHSGLVDLIIGGGHEVFTVIKDEKSGIEGEINPKVSLLKYPKDNHLGYIYNILHHALNNLNRSGFQFDPIPKKKGIRGFFYNSVVSLFAFLGKKRYLKKVLLKLETYFILTASKKEWLDLLDTNQIQIVLYNVPNTNLTCISAALKLNIKNYLIFHTNKDIHSIDRLMVTYDKYGVWSDSMKSSLMKKFRVPEKKIAVTGNLHLSFLMFKTKEILNYKPTKPHFLYICGALNISNEEIIIKKTINILQKIFQHNFCLTVRKNPMEIREIWEKYQSPQVSVVTPEWYYNIKRNFNFAKKIDLLEYKNQLTQADAIIGFPSSVIMEANLLGKDFINILVDEDGIIISNTQSAPSKLWDHILYENVKKFDASINVFNFSDFENLIKNYPKPKNRLNVNYMKAEFGILDREDLLQANLQLITL